MGVEPKKISLLYLDEHLTCSSYMVVPHTGFVLHESAPGDQWTLDTDETDCALFVLSGHLVFYHDEQPRGCVCIRKEQMFFISRHVANHVETLAPSVCLVLFWDKLVTPCDRMYMASLTQLKQNIPLTKRVLTIIDPLRKVLESLRFYVKHRMMCRHMHQIKQQELLLVLRAFYTKDDLGAFFSTPTAIDTPFEQMVWKNCDGANSVKEFAELCNMSERSFNRQFKAHFGQSPSVWLGRRRAEMIRKSIDDPDKTLSEIADEFDFSSQAHFTTYCKRHFGESPSALRKALHLRSTEDE